jgi:hypothetical protein
MPLETWRRQSSAFGLMKNVFAKPAAIRGQQQAAPVPAWPQQFQDWPPAGDDEYFC